MRILERRFVLLFSGEIMKAMEVTETNLAIIKNAYMQGKIEAIDEFLNKIYDVSDFVREHNTISGGYAFVTLENIEQIAEQMKKGEWI